MLLEKRNMTIKNFFEKNIDSVLSAHLWAVQKILMLIFWHSYFLMGYVILIIKGIVSYNNLRDRNLIIKGPLAHYPLII